MIVQSESRWKLLTKQEMGEKSFGREWSLRFCRIKLSIEYSSQRAKKSMKSAASSFVSVFLQNVFNVFLLIAIGYKLYNYCCFFFNLKIRRSLSGIKSFLKHLVY